MVFSLRRLWVGFTDIYTYCRIKNSLLYIFFSMVYRLYRSESMWLSVKSHTYIIIIMISDHRINAIFIIF